MSGANDILIANIKEKGNEVTAYLEKEGINIRYTALRLIDYLIAGRIAVIRRTVPAFMEDLSNKMVYRTAPEFKRTFPDPLYIVEGDRPASTISSTTHGRSGVTYLTFVNRIPIIFSSTPEETGKYLALMMKQVAFASTAETMSNGNNEKIDDESSAEIDAEVQLQVLSAIPGIKEDNAKALLAKYGSLRAIIDADETELSKVKGIGAKKAKAIMQAFNASAIEEQKQPVNRSSKAPLSR
ncbi:MAG: helix-hairpin-helix domain-containing protein [Candidatus Zixiibacteriota bacterium]